MKKALTIFLIIIMCVGCSNKLNNDNNEQKILKEKKSANDYKGFKTIKFGKYPQFKYEMWGKKNPYKKYLNEDIEWLVIYDDKANKKKLLLSKYILFISLYNMNNEYGARKKDFIGSSLYDRLNKDFLEKIELTDEERTKMIIDDYGYYFSILSLDDIKRYFNADNINLENKKLSTITTDYARRFIDDEYENYKSNLWSKYNFSYWIKDQCDDHEKFMCVNRDGSINKDGIYGFMRQLGVRPIVWINY